jgi:hypothetical protein
MQTRERLRLSELGITMFEMIAAVAVLSAVVLGAYSLTSQGVTDTRLSTTSMHLKAVGDAVDKYIRANRTAVAANATAAQLAKITVADLVAANYLPAGFSRTNPYGQEVCVLVLEPVADTLRVLVVAENVATSQPIEDANLAQVAAAIGGPGGGIYATPPPGILANSIVGTMAGWNFLKSEFEVNNNTGTNCAGTIGQVALTDGTPVMFLLFSSITTAAATAPVLYRDIVPGNPDLNTMNATIIMDALTIRGEGAGCPTLGALARNADGTVLSCTGPTMTWRRSGSAAWGNPVADFAALPATDPVGTVRLTLDTSRAFMWNGTAWVALSVDQSGNLNIPGISSGTVFIPTNLVVSGGACTTNGAIASDSTGAGIVVCSSGIWRTAPTGALGQFNCYDIPHILGTAMCNVGDYVVGSHDDGAGYVGDNGIRCCSPISTVATPPPATASCTPSVSWGASCSKTINLLVSDNAITPVNNYANDVAGFVGTADIQCQDANPAPGIVNPQWVIANPVCSVAVPPPPPITGTCPPTVSWSACGAPLSVTVSDNAVTTPSFTANTVVGVSGSADVACQDIDLTPGVVNAQWLVSSPVCTPIVGACGAFPGWDNGDTSAGPGPCGGAGFAVAPDNGSSGPITITNSNVGYTGSVTAECVDIDFPIGFIIPEWQFTGATCTPTALPPDSCFPAVLNWDTGTTDGTSGPCSSAAVVITPPDGISGPVALTNTTPGYTGTVTAQCYDGDPSPSNVAPEWVPLSGAICNPVALPPDTCGPTVNWNDGDLGLGGMVGNCGAPGSAITPNDGSSGVLTINNTNPGYTGTINVSCQDMELGALMDAQWVVGSATCTPVAPPPPGTCGPTAGWDAGSVGEDGGPCIATTGFQSAPDNSSSSPISLVNETAGQSGGVTAVCRDMDPAPMSILPEWQFTGANCFDAAIPAGACPATVSWGGGCSATRGALIINDQTMSSTFPTTNTAAGYAGSADVTCQDLNPADGTVNAQWVITNPTCNPSAAVTGTCSPSVSWPGGCSAPKSMVVDDNDITPISFTSNTAAGFNGNADVQCRDIEPTPSLVVPDWVVTNPTCNPIGPVTGTCGPTVTWNTDCSAPQSIVVNDGGITSAVNVANTAGGFTGNADVQCRDVNASVGLVNPQWVINNPTCAPSVVPTGTWTLGAYGACDNPALGLRGNRYASYSCTGGNGLCAGAQPPDEVLICGVVKYGGGAALACSSFTDVIILGGACTYDEIYLGAPNVGFGDCLEAFCD